MSGTGPAPATSAPEAAPVGAPDATDGPHPLGWPTWALVAAVLVPLVIGAAHFFADLRGYHAVNDNALNELVVRAMPGRLPLIGPYARNTWSHPGPLLYFLLWPMYHLFGADSAAMAVGALVINGAAVATVVAIARRWGGWSLALPLTLVLALISVRLPHGYVADPWNPALTVLPFGAFLLLTWAATCGDRWGLPVAAFVGSFCVQTHVGYLLLVIPLLGWALVRVGMRARRRGERGGFWVPLAWTAGVLVVVWAPPVIQQFTGHPGNLGEIYHYFRTSKEPTHSLADGWHVVTSQFTVTADWITGAPRVITIDKAALREVPLPLLLVAFVVAAGFAWRRWTALRELAVVIGLTVIFGILAVARTLGPMYDYRLRWVWVLAGLATAFVAAVAWRGVAAHLDHRLTHRVGTVLAGLTVAGIVALVVIAADHLVDYRPYRPEVLRTDRVADGILRDLDGRRDVVVLRPASYGGYIAVAGTMLRLADAGVPAQVEETTVRDIAQTRRTFGDERIHHGPLPPTVVVLVSGDDIAKVAALPGARRLAFAPGSLGVPHDDRAAAAIRVDDLAAFVVPTGA
jgi:hypothetical protein